MHTHHPVTDCLQIHLLAEQPTQLLAKKCTACLSSPWPFLVGLLAKCNQYARFIILIQVYQRGFHQVLNSSKSCPTTTYAPNRRNTVVVAKQFFMRNRAISIPLHLLKSLTRKAYICWDLAQSEVWLLTLCRVILQGATYCLLPHHIATQWCLENRYALLVTKP